MITMMTGLPGNGKTLFILCYVKALAERENRQVYYNGIANLTLPWIELEKGEDWFKVPPNSIVVLDEAQRIFRMRGVGANVPEHVAKLETHRHLGIDLFIITQHPMLVDTNVRRLVGQHFHAVRAWGMHRSVIHEWSEVKENCGKSREGSIKHVFKYPKEAFTWYKSAEVHTHKRNIPMRVILVCIAPFAIVGLCYYGYQNLFHSTVKSKSSASSAVVAPGKKGSDGVQKKSDEQWLLEQKPRIVGLPHTAPMYDGLARVSQMPLPAACIEMHDECRCYTQQGTRITDVQPIICKQIVKEGWFNPFLLEEKHEELQKVSYQNGQSGQANAVNDINANNVVMFGDSKDARGSKK